MARFILRFSVISLACALCWACDHFHQTDKQNASASKQSSGDVKFQPPAAWVTEPTTSNMRVAQYRLPRAEGDTADASLILYYFGQGQGGSAQANLDRWIGQ